MTPTEEQARLIAELRELALVAGPKGTLEVPVVVQAYLAQLDRLLDTGWTQRLEPDAELQCEDVFGFLSMDEAWRYEAAVRGPFVGPPRPPAVLLRGKIESEGDPLLMDVVELSRQHYRGRIVRRYGPARFAGPGGYPEVVEFVGEAEVYGNRVPADGERAIVFLHWLASSRRYSQAHWRAHLSVRAVDGIDHAVMQDGIVGGIGGHGWMPADLCDAAFQVGRDGPGLSGIYLPLARLEEHLREEVARAAEEPAR